MSYYKLLNKGTETSVEISANSPEKLFTIAFSSWLEIVSEQNNSGLEIKNIELNSKDCESLFKEFLNNLNNLLNTQKWLTIEITDLSIKKYNDVHFLNALFRGKNINSEDIKIRKVIKDIDFNSNGINLDSGYYFTNYNYQL
ncbi:MAG: archease [Ignavibacteria bacterium]|jgi:SHS2 domain-containing protein